MNLPTFTVLVVEDSVADLELYQRALCQDSTCVYQLLAAESIAAGLALCQTRFSRGEATLTTIGTSPPPIDVILLDYILPDGDGLDFIAALLVQNHGIMPPVVMMTGQGNENIAVRAIKLGAEDYLVKRDLTPELLQLKVRKAIENARLRQQQQQREHQIIAIWESMTDAYTMLDRDWRIVYTNPAATEIYRQTTGLVPAAYLGKTHWDVLPWTVGTIVEREYRRAVTDRVAVHFELLYEPTETWFEVHAYPSTEGLGIYFRDITQRKQSELERLAAEQERDRFFDLSIDLMIVANLDGYFIRVNPACEKVLGFTPAELMARPFLDFIHPDDRALTAAAAERLNAGDALVNFENRYRCQDRSYRWILWSAIPDAERNLLYANGHDITEQKQAQLNDRFLYELTQRLRQLTAVEEIQWEAVKSLGEYLDVDRAAWFEVDEERRLARISRDWYRGEAGSIVGDYPLNEFLSPTFQTAMFAGEPMAIADVTTDPLTAAYIDNYQQVGIRAFTNIPCLDDEGRWVMTLHLNTSQNVRSWRADEIQLMQTLVTQLWSFVAQARAVAALRAQEQQTRAAQAIVEQQLGEIESIYRTAPVGLCFVDTDFRWVRINDRLAQINGLSVAEHIGQTFREVLPELADRIEAQYRQVMASGEPIIDLEVTGFNRAQPGVERCWLASFYPQSDDRGRVIGVNNVVQEITARKREELQLKQAEATIREQLGEIEAIYRAAPIGLSFISTDLKFVRINDRLAQINGLSVAEHIGRTMREVLPEIADTIEPLYRQVIESGAPIFDLELSGSTPSQPSVERHWLASYYPQTDLGGRVVGVNAMVQEITDRKRIEAARLAAEQERDRFFNLSIDLLAIGNFDGYFTRLNPAWEQVLGFTTAELMARPCMDFVHPDDRHNLAVALETAAKTGTSTTNFENRYQCKDGSYRWLSWSTMPYPEQNLMYGIARDVTDLKRDRLALEDRNRELDSFVFVVSHDLKAPLRAVANLSQWIEEDLEAQLTADTRFSNGDALRTQMTLLRSRVGRMSATIDGLLDYARSGRSEDKIEPVALDRLLADVIDSVAPPPTFKIDLPAELPTIFTKRIPLFQVFVNLIGNGIKHHHSEAGTIEMTIAQSQDWYEFAIADDGPGIAPADRERMFKIFQAVNPQNRPDSTGIGLAIVKKIIEAEGGTIRLESQPERGTTFYFTWPQRS